MMRSHTSERRAARSATSLALATKPTPQVPLSAGRATTVIDSYGCSGGPIATGTEPSGERKCRA